MKYRPTWQTTARDWRRRERGVTVSLDPIHPEVTVRTPPGEMAGMTESEVRQLMNHLGEALDELRRRE